jgi:RND family efflux transporter MFP subunit
MVNQSRRRALIFGGLAVLLALMAWRTVDGLRARRPAQQGAGAQRPPAVVQVTPVRRATITVRASYVGEVTPRTRVDVVPRIPGIIASISVDEGDLVSRGQVVARIDPKEVRFQLEQARANLHTQRVQVDMARANLDTQRARLAQAAAGAPTEQVRQAEEQLRQARANLEYSRAQLRRAEELFGQGYVSGQQVDAARLDVTVQETRVRAAEEQLNQLRRGARTEDLQVSRAQVEEAEVAFRQAISRLNQTQLSVRQAQSLLAEATVYAPTSGVVARRFVYPGATVTSTSAIVQLIDVDPAVITVPVAEQDLSRILPGMPVMVRTDALPGKMFQGRVAGISPVLATATRTAEVKVDVPNPHRSLRPGMFASVEILVARREGVVTVPVDALIEQDNGQIVFVVEAQTARSRPVTTGISDGALVEIRSGVRIGEMVIVAGHRTLRDGAQVAVPDRRGPGTRPRP